MKRLLTLAFLIGGAASFSLAQVPDRFILANRTSTAPKVPQYLVYRHFLGG